MLREPPDILITTPESLYLMLTGRAQELFAGAESCIVDEIHAVASTKRGAHLALTLERLTARGRQRGPADRAVGDPEAARGDRPLHGRAAARPAGSSTPGSARSSTSRSRCRSTRWSSPTPRRRPDLDPLAGGTEATRRSIWPAIYPELLELSRRTARRSCSSTTAARAERLALRLNELAEHEIARAHHGSLAREERLVVEEMLKAGELPCLVATSSLELGIDMGAVDLVIQVESPKSVARGLQRIGRAGHSVGDVSRGRIFPKFRADLLECAVVAQADARRRDRDHGRAAQRARRARPADRGDRGRRARRPAGRASTSCTRWSPARTPTPSSAARSSRTCSTCSTAATRRSRVLRAAAADRLGPRARARSGRGRARASSRSPTPARSPTAGCTRSRCPTAGASASSTRRWSTRRARARRSCSARAPGGSRRSAATA